MPMDYKLREYELWAHRDDRTVYIEHLPCLADVEVSTLDDAYQWALQHECPQTQETQT